MNKAMEFTDEAHEFYTRAVVDYLKSKGVDVHWVDFPEDGQTPFFDIQLPPESGLIRAGEEQPDPVVLRVMGTMFDPRFHA